MQRKGGYDTYLGKEDRLQIAVVNYMKVAYPKITPVHVPNEGKRTRFESWKLKQMGMTAGVPDIMIFFQRPESEGSDRIYSGLAIELKVKPNKPTGKQLQFLSLLHDNGWYTAVTYDFDTTKIIIDKYLKLKKM